MPTGARWRAALSDLVRHGPRCHRDGIPHARERRRVREVEIDQLRYEHPGVQRGGDRVGPLGRPDLAQPLRAEQPARATLRAHLKSEEHTSELQSLKRISYAVFCLK